MTAISVECDLLADLRKQLAIQLQAEGYLVPPAAPGRDVCIMWANLRFRHISRRPRVTKWSATLRRRNLDSPTRAALRKITAASDSGRNLNPHLSKKYLNAWFNDLLFNDWQIHHMHLGPRSGRWTGRSGELLFALITDSTLHLVNVLDHDCFADVRLLQVIREDFPDVLPLVETEGMSETGEPTREERQRLREAGILVPVTLGGKLFFPTSGGITTSGCMSAAVSECDRLLDALSNVEESLRDARRLREILERFAPAPPQLGAYKFKLLVAGRDFLLLVQNTQTRIPLFRMTFERK